jgi:hypothetical protein
MMPTNAATQGIDAYSIGRFRTLANIDDQLFLGSSTVTTVAVCLFVIIMGVLLVIDDVLPAILTVMTAAGGAGARRGIAHEALLLATIMVAILD